MAEPEKKAKKQSPKQTLIQIAKFVAFSMGAGIIQLVSYALIHELTGWEHWKCYLPSLVLSVLYNFTVNRRYTFKSATNVPIAMLKVAFYYCLCTPRNSTPVCDTVGAANRQSEKSVFPSVLLKKLFC